MKGLGATIRGVASTGASAVAALTGLGCGDAKPDEQIYLLAARVSLTVAGLLSVAETVEGHVAGFKKEAFLRTWRHVLNACRVIYSSIQHAVREAERRQMGQLRSRDAMRERLIRVLGVADEESELEVALDSCARKVILLQQIVKATALCLDAKSQSPHVEHVDAQRGLKTDAVDLMAALNEHEMMPGRTGGRHNEEEEDDSHDVDRSVKQTGTKSPTHAKYPKSACSTEESAHSTSESSFIFEAYYIVPRTIASSSPKGTVHAIKPPLDEYMILSADTITSSSPSHRASRDRNVRHALRRARRISSSRVTFLETATFPEQVQETIGRLVRIRSEHTNGEDWKLVDGVELKYVREKQGILRRRSTPRAAFLVVLRGTKAESSHQDKHPNTKQHRPVVSDSLLHDEHGSPKRKKHRKRRSLGTEIERPKPQPREGSPTPSAATVKSNERATHKPTASRPAPNRSSLRKSSPTYLDESPPRLIPSRDTRIPSPSSPTMTRGKPTQRVPSIESQRKRHDADRGAGPSEVTQYPGTADANAAHETESSPEAEAWTRMHQLMAQFARI